MTRVTLRALALMLLSIVLSGCEDADTLTDQTQGYKGGTGAPFCISPFKLREASEATKQRDDAWLHSLGCIQLSDSVPMTIIESNSLGDKVRLQPPGRQGITLWREACCQ